MVPVPKLGTLAVRAAFIAGHHGYDAAELGRLLGGAGLFSAGLLLIALFVFGPARWVQAQSRIPSALLRNWTIATHWSSMS